MAKNKKLNKKSEGYFFKKICHWHGWGTLFFLIVYISVSIVFDPRFLVRDAREKYQALAEDVAVTLYVPDIPGQPVLETFLGCTSGNPFIDLRWEETSDTENYDLYRNAVLLANHITDISYHDDDIAENVFYQYQVVANGPRGSTASAIISTQNSLCQPGITIIPSGSDNDSDSDNDNKKKKSRKKKAAAFFIPSSLKKPILSEFEIILKVDNPDHIVWAGRELEIMLELTGLSPKTENSEEKITYTVISERGAVIWQSFQTDNFFEKRLIKEKIPISRLVESGNYKIFAEINHKGDIYSSENYFIVKEMPFVNIGSASLTFTEFMRLIGWIVWLSLLLLILFLIALGIEHHLSQKAVFHITENYLAKKGFIRRRKGVRS